MSTTLRSLDALVETGLLQEGEQQALADVAARYAIALTGTVADLSRSSSQVARQFVPDAREGVVQSYELDDPISDHAFSPVEGLVHRYPDRVLLKIVSACPVYCRFCFRREMVGGQGQGLLPDTAFEAALAYIAERPQIREVILTGGDPLILSARRIASITKRLNAIGHLSVIRWHTRVPVVNPDRMTPALLRALSAGEKAVFVAIHANHPSEFTPEAATALKAMRRAGLTLISQSVLLNGVNDDIDTLEALMRAFLTHGVKPYYLHHPDLAPGTSHFRLPFKRGLALMSQLNERLSGLGLPAYILDVPGGAGKQRVEVALREAIPGHVRARDGSLVRHPDAD